MLHFALILHVWISMRAGRGECSCGSCACSSSTPDGLGPPYRGSACECPPEEDICLNPTDDVSVYSSSCMY